MDLGSAKLALITVAIFAYLSNEHVLAQSSSTGQHSEPVITDYFESDNWKVTSFQSPQYVNCQIASQANRDTETGIIFTRFGYSFMLWDTKFEEKKLGKIGISVSVDAHPEWRFRNVGTDTRNSSMEMAELYDGGQPFFNQLLEGDVLQIRDTRSGELFFTLKISGFDEASEYFFECIDKVF